MVFIVNDKIYKTKRALFEKQIQMKTVSWSYNFLKYDIKKTPENISNKSFNRHSSLWIFSYLNICAFDFSDRTIYKIIKKKMN